MNFLKPNRTLGKHLMLSAGDISRPEKCGGDFNLESRSLASGLVVRPGATLDEIFHSNVEHRCVKFKVTDKM